MPSLRRYIIFILFCSAAFGVSSIWAQSVFWSPAKGTMQEGKVNNLDLYFESCEPTGNVDLPALQGLSLTYRGSSTSRSIMNGRASSKVVYSYQAVPTSQGTVTIPSFTVSTSEGDMTVPAANYVVVEATVGNTGAKPSDVFLARFQIRDPEIYRGEVIQVDYYAGAKQEYQLVDLSDPQWEPGKLVTSGLKETQAGPVDVQGERYIAKAYQAKAIATESGTIQLPGTEQTATLVIGRRREFLFQEPIYDTYTIKADPFALEIKPLPENAPASFKGAVGQFKLESRVVPEQVQVGEPITWTLELSGEGNWPMGVSVPQRSVSKNFRTIQPQLNTEFAEDNLFSGKQTEDIVLIPTAAGSYDFGPLEYSYFDPQDGTYKTIEIPAKTVTVIPATAPSGPDTGLPSGGQTQETYSDGDTSSALAPTGDDAASRPPMLPKDPAAPTKARAIPAGDSDLTVPTFAVAGIAFAYWALLAVFASFRADKKRTNRAALKILRAYARRAPAQNEAELRAMQRVWRPAAARYFGLSSREPSADEIHAAAKAAGGEALAAKWKELWLLSDQFLFGARAPDLKRWGELYKQTILASPTPSYSPSLIFKRSSWFGLLAFSIFATSLTPPSRAETAEELYERGEFAKAETQWVQRINENPGVFEYRYNAGLAASQQKQWGKAWAYWAGAFCLDPNDKNVVWNLRLAHTNTSAYDPVLQSLLDREGFYKVVRLRSPAGWETLAQLMLLGAGVCLLAAITLLYLRPLRFLFGYLLIVAVLVGLGSYFSLWAASKYEALRQPETLLITQSTPLNSIPSDLDEQQISTEIREGAIVRPIRAFLGWQKVEAPNGESGWVRQEAVLPLYGPIPTNG